MAGPAVAPLRGCRRVPRVAAAVAVAAAATLALAPGGFAADDATAGKAPTGKSAMDELPAGQAAAGSGPAVRPDDGHDDHDHDHGDPHDAAAARAARKKAKAERGAASGAEPPTAGRGIESAVLVGAGRARVEQLAGDEASRYFGAVVDIRVAEASTTPPLGATTIVAEADAAGAGANGGEAATIPVAAACLPTAGVQMTMWHAPGVTLHEWTVNVGGRRWTCGGRHAREAFAPGSGGVRLTTRRGGAWSGPLLLLFDTARDDVRRVRLPGFALPVAARPAS